LQIYNLNLNTIIKFRNWPISRGTTQRSAVKRVTRDAELLERRDDRRPAPHPAAMLLLLLLMLLLLRQDAVVNAPTARLFLRAS